MAYLRGIKSLQRYDLAFKKFWAFCKVHNFDMSTATIPEVAAQLQLMATYFPSESKNVYSALLKIPGLDQLRFSPLLQACKKLWQKSAPKYATFWDPEPKIQQLMKEPLDINNVSQVRDRLIMSWRFFMLYRNVDLARCFRTVSVIDNRAYVLVQRKNWTQPQFEEVVQLPSCAHMCPWFLLRRYVFLTNHVGTLSSGLTPVLWSLFPPWKPLSANTIGSLTKKCLRRLGLDMELWGPHSTRGAAVGMYKRFQFSSEEVCELGRWKNAQAFQAHYLRLGVANTVQGRLANLVHTASPLESDELDLTWTQRSPGDLGGNVRESEAQSNGEPTPPPRRRTARKRARTQSPNRSPPRRFEFARNRSVGPPIAGTSALTQE